MNRFHLGVVTGALTQAFLASASGKGYMCFGQSRASAYLNQSVHVQSELLNPNSPSVHVQMNLGQYGFEKPAGEATLQAGQAVGTWTGTTTGGTTITLTMGDEIIQLGTKTGLQASFQLTTSGQTSQPLIIPAVCEWIEPMPF